ncbi:MAG: hypothetical protein Q7V88_08730 [Actinomycetota bacterium]|nr:hypothetical protein [Actinomycetota bacterium]
MARLRATALAGRARPVALAFAALVALVAMTASDGPPDRGPGVVAIAADALTTTTVPRTSQPATSTSGAGTTSSTTPPATGTPTGTSTTVAVPTEPPEDVSRPVPPAEPVTPPPAAPPPPWAASITTTAAGYTSTAIGCAANTGAAALDALFAGRVGPLLGADYQHVVALGGNRYGWFFQDAFIDQSGAASRLDQAHFAHNIALIQDGNCFTMLHRGSAARPASFEQGNGENPATKWFWPMGAETIGGRLQMFWAEMVKDPYTPGPGDGLGWHPARMWLGTYDAGTLKRLSFQPAPNSGVSPLYGYAVASDATHSYLFGNTFEQNLVREGGYFNGPHSATQMYLARVPVGQLGSAPEYRTADGWSANAADARPFMQRYWVENPMQPRFLGGQWVSAAKVDGYWGEQLVVEVANQPWGPWTASEFRQLAPRGGDPKMNTYHAHLLPWRTAGGSLIVTVSQNARLMTRDAFPHPERYRPAVFTSGWAVAPPDPVPTTTTTSTTSTSTTSTSTTSTTTTSTSTTSTTSTTTPPTSSSTSTTTSTTSTSTSTTSSLPATVP